MFVVVAKIVISLICAGLAGAIVIYQHPIKNRLGQYSERSVLGIAWLVTRLLPFFLIFVVLDFTPFSDLDGFYWQAREAVQLKMVYRDFYCMYSPVFPYFNALALWFWPDKKAIILLMLLVDGLALWTTNRFYENQLPKNERLYRSLIYLVAPGSLVFSVLGGQEDEWMWLMLAGAVLLWQRTHRVAWFGVGLVVGFMCTKAVFILVIPALLLLVPKPTNWIASAAIAGGICLALLIYSTEWLWLEQPLHEAATLRAPNWLSVLNPLFFNHLHAGAKGWNWLGLLATTGGGTWLAYRVRHADFTRAFSAVFVVIYATMMVAQQSAYSNYIFIFLLPLTFVWIDFNNRKEVILFLLFNVLSVVHPSLWWRLKSPYYASPAAVFAQPVYVLDYVLQVGIVLCTFYFLRLVWQKATEF
ncbi:MAG: hypothetical protein U0X91_00995 [Spirosomataceae bacterium]